MFVCESWMLVKMLMMHWCRFIRGYLSATRLQQSLCHSSPRWVVSPFPFHVFLFIASLNILSCTPRFRVFYFLPPRIFFPKSHVFRSSSLTHFFSFTFTFWLSSLFLSTTFTLTIPHLPFSITTFTFSCIIPHLHWELTFSLSPLSLSVLFPPGWFSGDSTEPQHFRHHPCAQPGIWPTKNVSYNYNNYYLTIIIKPITNFKSK